MVFTASPQAPHLNIKNAIFYPFISISHQQTSRSEISGLRIANLAYSYRTRDFNLGHAPSCWHKKQEKMLKRTWSGSASPGLTRTMTESVSSRRLID